MKNLIFIGALFLVGSCTMQNYYFNKRIPVISEKISPPEFISQEENTADLSIIKPVQEQNLTFELSTHINSAEILIPGQTTDTLKNVAPMYKTTDSIKHNECRCFAKGLIMSGSTLAVMGVLTFFSWTTLGIGALIIGAIMIIAGVIIIKKL